MGSYNDTHRQVAAWLTNEDVARLTRLALAERVSLSGMARRLLEAALHERVPDKPTCRPAPVRRRGREPVVPAAPIAPVPPVVAEPESAPRADEVRQPWTPKRFLDGLPATVQPPKTWMPAGRSLTAELMGDPPPGRSALDEKRSQRPAPADGGA